MKEGISVIIPNWNGKYLLDEYLPSLYESVSILEIAYEIIVVDDASTDDSILFLKEKYPQIRLIVNQVNKGFPATCNKGIKAAKYQWILILNNDVKLTQRYIKQLLQNTVIGDLFSVSGKILALGTNEIIDGGKLGKFIAGNFRVTSNYVVQEEDITPGLYYTFYNPATCCLYNRDKLAALGGFDECFNPFNWEDTDVAYRAWKRGWISVFDPRPTAYHVPGTTINTSFKKKRIYIISRRNKFIFHWKNLSDSSLFAQNIGITFLNVCIRWLLLDIKYYVALGKAFAKLSDIIIKRREEVKHRLLKDRDVVKYIEQTCKRREVRFF